MTFISNRIFSEHFSFVYLLHFFSLCAAASSWRRICCHSSCATCSRDVGGTSVSSCSRLSTSSLKTSATKHLSVRNLYICHCCTMTKRQNTQIVTKKTVIAWDRTKVLQTLNILFENIRNETPLCEKPLYLSLLYNDQKAKHTNHDKENCYCMGQDKSASDSQHPL